MLPFLSLYVEYSYTISIFPHFLELYKTSNMILLKTPPPQKHVLTTRLFRLLYLQGLFWVDEVQLGDPFQTGPSLCLWKAHLSSVKQSDGVSKKISKRNNIGKLEYTVSCYWSKLSFESAYTNAWHSNIHDHLPCRRVGGQEGIHEGVVLVYKNWFILQQWGLFCNFRLNYIFSLFVCFVFETVPLSLNIRFLLQAQIE